MEWGKWEEKKAVHITLSVSYNGMFLDFQITDAWNKGCVRYVVGSLRVCFPKSSFKGIKRFESIAYHHERQKNSNVNATAILLVISIL